jgi:hypothetical protein
MPKIKAVIHSIEKKELQFQGIAELFVQVQDPLRSKSRPISFAGGG